MAVASWMLRSRSVRAAKSLRNRAENRDDIVQLDFNLEPSCLMQEVLTNICQRSGVSSFKKLNYLNAFVQLVNKYPNWKTADTFGFTIDEIMCCLRIALIQDSVQVRAAGLRALRYIVRSEDDFLAMNRLLFPYFIARSLDLLLKSDNERVLMSERIQSLKMMRHILFIAPHQFSCTLVRPLISVALRPVEETDRLLKACLAVLCEICVLNSAVFIECDGVRALLRNTTMIPSSHMVEAICGALLFLLNKPAVRMTAKIDLRYVISGYTNSAVVEKNTFREEERRLLWTNFVILTLLKSCSGVFELCSYVQNMSGLKSVVQTLCINNQKIRKAILELLCELLNISQPEWTDDENIALESIQFSQHRESFKLSEGFLVSEGKMLLPNFSKTRVNLTEVHTSLLLMCLLDVGLPDILVEVIVSSDAFVSLQACIFLGQFLHLTRRLLPVECNVVPPSLPNLVSYAIRGCPLQSYLAPIMYDLPDTTSEPNEQYFLNYSCPTNNFQYNNSTEKTLNPGDKTKVLDVRLSLPNLNVPDTCATKSLSNGAVTKDKVRLPGASNDDDVDVHESAASRHVDPPDFLHSSVLHFKSESWTDHIFSEDRTKDFAKVLNKNRVDFPPCKQKQRMAMSAVKVLTNLQRRLDRPKSPVSMLLNNVIQYGDRSSNLIEKTKKDTKKKFHKIPVKDLEELLKDTGVLNALDASRWKWESVRILLKLSSHNVKFFNDANFKLFIKKLVHFYKPSSKKFSNTPMKYDVNTTNIYTLVACELFDILLNDNNAEGGKFLLEFLEDLCVQLKQLTEMKSVHDCLLSPQRLTNSLSQDYFLIIGRLSNNEYGLSLLEKANVFQRLNHIVVNTNLDCYVKLIISSLSYISNDITRKLFSAVLSCTYVSSRLYATKFLHVLLRTSASNHESFRNWAIEMLTNQLYDENQTIKMIALNALNEAVDNKDYLDVLISLRPSLLHLGDDGLLLLIRFLSTEKGFSYLQAANFIGPQLQRWASSFNTKYTQIVEGELHDAMSQYQRGDDGRYRKRITGNKAVYKDIIVPPHLYGQLVQHWQGFSLLLKQESVHKMIQVILVGNYETDETIMELKSALWAMGHFSTSSAGAKYLSDYGIVNAMVDLAERATVYSVKQTAFYVLSLVATTKVGVAALNKTGWRCLQRNRHDSYLTPNNNSFASFLLDKFWDDDDSETISSPVDFESPQNMKTLLDQDEEETASKDDPNKFSFEKKSATLPQRNVCTSQILHTRSYSESKADTVDDWSSSDSPPNARKYLSEISRSNTEPSKYFADSATDSTSGISSSDSVLGKQQNLNEKISKLSPIPSTSSLNTLISDMNQKEHRSFLAKRHPSISFSCRFSPQNALGYKTLRFLQTRHNFSTPPCFSASATMEYLSADDRRQMSPLVRPKFMHYLPKQFTPDDNELVNVSSTIESSRFSHSTEIDDEKSEISGPCYQGVCLPSRLSYFIPRKRKVKRNLIPSKSPQMLRINDDNDVSGDSEPEQTKADVEKTFSNAYKRRRHHDKLCCLLCSSRNHHGGSNIVRSRKTSTSSVYRSRTETESSYGGGIGFDTESPILLTWQQKPLGLVDTPGGASSSTLGTSESQHTSAMTSNDNALKSRSILRKEILKLIEQLGNPVLYKTCKQGLLHLKQICGDLFQDVCLFSDVCSLLGKINYRIHARQLIQDLFLDTPFLELYEEACEVLNRTSVTAADSEDTSTTGSTTSCPSECAPISAAAEPKLSSVPKSPAISKEPASPAESANDERKSSTANGHHLEVIIETDAGSDPSTTPTTTKCRVSPGATTPPKGCFDDVNVAIIEKTLNALSLLAAEETQSPDAAAGGPPRPAACNAREDGPGDPAAGCDRPKYRFDCRRAYSYPVTNHIGPAAGSPDAKVRYVTAAAARAFACPAPAARSRSVSATCSYISEISAATAHLQRQLDVAVDVAVAKRSLIALAERQRPSVLLQLDGGTPYDVLRSKLALQDGSGDGQKRGCDEIRASGAEAADRRRKLAAFESPDQTLLVEPDANI